MGGKLRQWYAALACGFGAFLAGGAYTWVTPLMLKFIEPASPVPMTTSDTSWLAASIEISAVLCTIPFGRMADKLGRKYVLISIGPICLISWIIILTTRHIEALYAARIFHGLALGLVYVVGPMYMAEIAEPADRGKVGGIFQPAYYAGCVFSVSLGPFVSYDNFAIAHIVPAVIFTIAMAMVPESPYYLVMCGKHQKGTEALAWLRGKDVEDVRKEFDIISASVMEDMKNKGSIADLFRTSRDRKSFMLVQSVCIVKYLGGSTAIAVYVNQTFSETLPGLFASEFFSIAFMCLLVLASFASSVISDYIGRRPLLLISVTGSGICSIIVGVIFFMDSDTTVDVQEFLWISFVGMTGMVVLSNIGLGPLAQTIQAEYFPSNTRAIGSSLTQMVAAITAFINVKQYQMASDLAGVYLNYWIFAAVSISGLALFYFLIPETKGQSLGQIQKSFSHNV